FECGNYCDAAMRILVGILAFQIRCDPFHLSPRCRLGDAGFQPRDYVHVVSAALFKHTRVQGHGRPQVDVLRVDWKLEACGHDSEYCVTFGTEGQRSTEDTRIASEALSPESMTEKHHSRVLAVFLFSEGAPD